MLVWNSNQALETVVGYGAKDVTVEYSVDGADVDETGRHGIRRCSGRCRPARRTPQVAFGGVPAKFVKLTINSNWGGVLPQYGLSEVRFSYIPVGGRQSEARRPAPSSWKAGGSELASGPRGRLPRGLPRDRQGQSGSARHRRTDQLRGRRSSWTRPTTGRSSRSMRPPRRRAGRAMSGPSRPKNCRRTRASRTWPPSTPWRTTSTTARATASTAR